MFKEPALQSLYQQGQFQQAKMADLGRLARERLVAQPGDAQAVLALALATLEGNDRPARQDVIGRAEACIQQQPQAAACHYALGVVLGVQSMAEGMMKAARSAGTVKAALSQAQTLEPGWYPARSALVEFYLLAPGLMGGSTARAHELARSAPNPDQARVLQARVDLQEGRTAAVLQSVSSALQASDAALASDAAQWGFAAASKLINEGQAAQAQPFLERLTRERPASANGPYGLARVQAAAGAHAEALKLYDQAAKAADVSGLPLDYRRGIALQELGRLDDARAAYMRFVSAGKGQKASLEDARKRLQALGS
jgi:tetratricopeptide (TPR) repeat protein